VDASVKTINIFRRCIKTINFDKENRPCWNCSRQWNCCDVNYKGKCGDFKPHMLTNREEAWAAQEIYKGKPHGWVQWKGTHVCMDIHCECGVMTHIDDTFVYYVKCPCCGRVYMCNGHIQLLEVAYRPLHDIKMADNDEGCD